MLLSNDFVGRADNLLSREECPSAKIPNARARLALPARVRAQTSAGRGE